MNKKVLFTVLLSVATVIGVSAQRIVGNISPLKGQQEVNVVLDFSGVIVNGETEENFIAEETKGKKDADKKKWLSEWNKDLRSEAYASLIKELNGKVSGRHFSAGKYSGAEYTIIIRVREITTGFWASRASAPSRPKGPSRPSVPSPRLTPRPSSVSNASAVRADVSFVKTGETVPFATTEFKRSSNNSSSDMPYLVTKIALSFGTLGEDIGNAINKALKK